MTLSVWLARSRKPWWVSAIPMFFMMFMTLWSLLLLIRPALAELFSTHPHVDPVGLVALFLLILALLLIAEALKSLKVSPEPVQQQ